MATKKVAIRQLARNHRESKKHIDSPLAKYNSSGQLLCVLCNVPIKSALLWDSHIFGKKHKQNLADLKSKSNRSNQTAVNPTVVSASQNDDFTFVRPQTKRIHNEIESPGVIPEKKIKVSSDTATDSLTDKPGDGIPIKEQENNSSGSNLLNTTPNLPSDFFDSLQDAKQLTEQNISSNSDSVGGSIPEGFFDDPKQDAKVRKVEYKDPIEEEWEKFQKAMQVESQVSQSILEDEDEESRVDRELSELSEQRLFFLRADALRDRQSIIRDKVTEEAVLRKDVKDEHSNDSDDSDFEEFFDWRAKKAL